MLLVSAIDCEAMIIIITIIKIINNNKCCDNIDIDIGINACGLSRAGVVQRGVQ